MKYRKSVMIVYAVMLILGAALLITGLILGADPDMYLVKSFCIPSGIVLLIFSFFNIIMQLTMNEKKRKLNQIEFNDERNLQIRGRTAYTTQMIIIPMLGVACFVAALCNEIIGSFIIAGVLLTDAASMLILTWYYSKKL